MLILFTPAAPPPPPPAPAPPTIAVNGSASGAIVAPNTAMSIVVAGGPGERTDWVGIATPNQPQNTETEYAYLVTGTTQRPPVGTPGVTSATLSLLAPSATGVNAGEKMYQRAGVKLHHRGVPNAPPEGFLLRDKQDEKRIASSANVPETLSVASPSALPLPQSI